MNAAKGIQSCFHHCHTLLHHLTDRTGCLVGEKIRDPYHFALAVLAPDNLSRPIVMGHELAARGPNEALGLMVDIDNQFANDHAVGEVTIRAPGSSRVSMTKPGANRVCKVPTSRRAAHTASTLALVEISFRMEAMFVCSPMLLRSRRR